MVSKNVKHLEKNWNDISSFKNVNIKIHTNSDYFIYLTRCDPFRTIKEKRQYKNTLQDSKQTCVRVITIKIWPRKEGCFQLYMLQDRRKVLIFQHSQNFPVLQKCSCCFHIVWSGFWVTLVSAVFTFWLHSHETHSPRHTRVQQRPCRDHLSQAVRIRLFASF